MKDIKVIIHPYTKKRDRYWIEDFVRLFLWYVFVVYLLWTPYYLTQGVLAVAFFLYAYSVFRNYKKKQEEEVILEWTNKVKKEEIENEFKKIEKNKNEFLKHYKKMVITNQGIYLGKRKCYRYKNDQMKSMDLLSVEKKENFIVLSFGAMGISTYKIYLYLPKKEQKNVKFKF